MQSDEIGEAMLSLRAFMFDRVYLGPHVEPEHRRARDVIQSIFERLVDEPELLPPGRESFRTGSSTTWPA